MKTIHKIVIILTLIMLLSSCTLQSTQEPQINATPLVPESENTPYPITDNSIESSTYPIPVQHETEVPPYMIPGFVTMTPDADLSSIIVSDVKHEGDVESIYITNISADTHDISKYMIYSPASDARKILPNNLILEPGETYVLYNGTSLENYPVDQRWLDTPVLTQALDEVWLTNSAARILYYFIYYPSITP
ncbi:MAG: hypothetical protein WCY93_10445 [Anaerolineaceae bacterium]